MRQMTLKRLSTCGLLLLGVCWSALSAPSEVPMPAGISIGLTLEGPTFVDANGMTLYTMRGSCTPDRRIVIQQPVSNDGDLGGYSVTVNGARSCLDKRPPLLAPSGAKPIGKWTLQQAADGTSQWAYAGKLLYRSIKDKAPGDINASYPTRIGRGREMSVAQAPLVGAPAGITAIETARGLALATHSGKALYFRDQDASAGAAECRGECAHRWEPLAAPAIVSTDALSSDWSVASRKDGARQWAWGGRPLYIYMYDSPRHGEQFWNDTFGGTWEEGIPGWQVALLKRAPEHPADVVLQALSGENEVQNFGLPKIVYADSKGMTLYTMHCPLEDIDCDDVGDDPRYWLSFCGGEQRCNKTWRPLRAPSKAKSTDGIWSVVVINASHPWRPVESGRPGIEVWAYRGRPVFTYAFDVRPGDYNGDDHGFGTTGSGQMQARPILAYAAQKVGKPVLANLERKR